LLWVVPRLLPATTPRPIRIWIALIAVGFLSLIARFDLYALVFRAMGFAVEKVWHCPVAATSLNEFWGQRWNRIVSGFLREVVFFPIARLAGARTALLVVFLYSGLYHEIVSFLADSGHGGPMAYFLVQYLGILAESSGPGRRLLRRRPRLGRLWTLAVVTLPLGLILQRPFIERWLVPLFVEARVPGLEP
jgi:alginate O-acetyltransferase complex protein AlgI